MVEIEIADSPEDNLGLVQSLSGEFGGGRAPPNLKFPLLLSCTYLRSQGSGFFSLFGKVLLQRSKGKGIKTFSLFSFPG